MSKFYKLVVATVVAMSFTAASAIAFEGFSIGIIGNASDFDTTGKEVEGLPIGSAQNDPTARETTNASHSKSVEFPSIFVEYTSASSTPFGVTFGVEIIPGSAEIGAKSRTDTQSDTGETNSNDSGTYTAKAEISSHASIYIEPTIMANDNFGFYLKGGGTTINVRSLDSIKFGENSSEYGNERVFGTMIGAGIKGVFGPGFLFKLEYTETDYSNVILTSATGNRNTIHADTDQSSVRFAIGYNF